MHIQQDINTDVEINSLKDLSKLKPELFTELQRNPTITCLSSDWA